ncbi:hypothetical protein COEREDRAFT_85166 [Coemansia reversa NRRL 1564]|uniref:Uncharacterized protein n=1 Tax=Coemansia reversa (strain ATCC 12441 / NRRL 1564) TaxID=763665 RepID=A0A2G5BIB6_COERN|nr:hypothetical protein COEREDRAFT_85166 [Coemansia reversa NRRL 1564]|eukprot:PIA18712.1 hypothetical protein COEREDRAFT_85166 [Coemansia reversa NRRL 1564]
MPVIQRFRNLLSKVAGSLGRSDNSHPSKLKHSVWHQRSQGSSRASSPSAASFSGDTAAPMELKGVPEVSTRIEVEAENASQTQTETIQSAHIDPTAPTLGGDKGIYVGDISAGAPRNLDPAAPNNTTDEGGGKCAVFVRNGDFAKCLVVRNSNCLLLPSLFILLYAIDVCFLCKYLHFGALLSAVVETAYLQNALLICCCFPHPTQSKCYSISRLVLAVS